MLEIYKIGYLVVSSSEMKKRERERGKIMRWTFFFFHIYLTYYINYMYVKQRFLDCANSTLIFFVIICCHFISSYMMLCLETIKTVHVCMYGYKKKRMIF